MDPCFQTITYQPYWWQEAPPTEVPEREPILEADVVIVGAGFAGLSAALTALRHGKSVAVFDAGDPGRGASTRNGGLCSGSLRPSFSSLMQSEGLDRAKEIYNEGIIARDNLRQFCLDEKINADLSIKGRFLGASTAKEFEGLKHQVDLMNTHLDLGCTVIDPQDIETEIASPMYEGGIIQPDIGGYHPGKFHAGLVQLVLKEGGQIFGFTPVIGIETERGKANPGSLVKTKDFQVRADKVIVTTNGYTGDVDRGRFDKFLRKRLIPVASSIIVTDEIAPNLMQKVMPTMRMYGDTLHIHSYFRPTPDGKRILFGSRSPEQHGVTVKTARFLHDRLTQIVPDLKETPVSFCWQGNVAFNMDMMPRLFSHRDIHYAVGFCGSGTIWARWLGRQVAEKALGISNQKSVFDGPPPRGLPFYDGRPYFIHASIAWYRMRDWLTMRGKTDKKRSAS